MKNSRRLPVRVMQGLLVIAVVAGVPVVALETATHVLVNQQAVESWTDAEGGVTRNRLDQVLTEVLGYREGRGTRLGGRLIQEWIDLGGELEDEGSALTGSGRFYRHFHDPLQPWNAAGLTFRGPNESSVRWMQSRDQESAGAAGGNWSWHDARRIYYQSLTESDPARREALLAATFRALGQIMHLVVDVSNPDHARNDAHWLASVPLLGFWNYDKWVQSQHGAPGTDVERAFVTRLLSNPVGPDPAVLAIPIPGSEPANVPIARLIDTDAYNGSNPSVTFNAAAPSAPAAIGLAEVANANFFSESTLTGPYSFPPPGTDGLIRTELLTPRRTPDGRHIVRRYWTRPEGQGLLPANPLRAECAGAGPRKGPARPYRCVDGVVWDQVAAHMLPRAVGYARWVLDYFFRGSMRVHTLYADAGSAVIQIENLADEEMEGVFEIYARPMADASNESRKKVGLVNDGAVTTVSPHATVALPVTLLPAEHPTASQILVFHGRLGLEQDSVAAQIFDVRHVLITQTAATAIMGESCDAFGYYSDEKGFSCSWRASSYHVQGELLADATVPIIARVSTAWELTAGKKSAQIELDGVPVPGGVWHRQGTEPDPRRFRIMAGVNHGNRLVLSVQLVSGDTVATPMAVLAFASAYSKTHYTNPTSHLETGPWWAAAERNASTLVFVHPPFRILSIGGHPNPTSKMENRFGILNLREYFLVQDETRGTSSLQRWIDFAEVIATPPPGGPIALRPILKAKFEAMPVSPLPDVPMEAEVERVYEPAELEFLKTFVTSDPPPQTFTIVGRRSGD